jgi:alkanesulfonate monooxygenase SsuD/methylene tetrahydromethanopterin reductase-like flavin-dependent oxidoreductase (luciferase family)
MYQYPETTGIDADLLDAGPVGELAEAAEAAGYLKGEFRALGVEFEERNALMDEALDVLPMHWRGEPFSYRGLHFEARDVIARPRPVQNPIPIWLGGNAKVTIRRVAERAQGWMPLVASSEVASTARTAYLSTLDEIASKLRDLREQAGDRADEIDVAYAYTDPSIATPGDDVERHREALGKLEELGVSWVIIPAPTGAPQMTLDFIQAFGTTYTK